MKNIESYLKQAFIGLLCLASSLANAAESGPQLRADGIVLPQSPAGVSAKTGGVELMIAVDPNGDVASVTVLSSTHPALEQAAQSAVARWKFAPASKGGQSTIGMFRHAFVVEDGRFQVDDKLLRAFSGAINEPSLRADGIVLPELGSELASVSGTAEFLVAVDSEGRVADIITKSASDERLAKGLLRALEQWRFDPVTRGGEAVAGLYRQVFRYEDGKHLFDDKLWAVLSGAGNEPTLKAEGLVLPKLPSNSIALTGTADIMVAVNRKGRVASVVSVASTDMGIAKSIEHAVRSWQFEPALVDGRPVVGFYRHAFHFKDGVQLFDDRLWDILKTDPIEPTLRAEGLTLPELPRSLANYTGKFDMYIAVDVDGKVVGVTSEEGANEDLAAAVRSAVKNWTFDPAVADGKPVVGVYRQTFRYEDGENLFGGKLWKVMQSAVGQGVSKRESKPSAAEREPVAALQSEVARVEVDESVIDLDRAKFKFEYRAEPELPAELANVRGWVNLVIDVSPVGRVSSVSTEAYSHEELIELCVRAGFASRFEPTGLARSTKVRVPYVFNEKANKPRWESLIDAQFGKVDKKPEVIRSFVPDWSRSASAREGEFQALLAIDRFGYVTHVEIERGFGGDADSKAEEALLRWKYSPAEVGGRPVESKLRQTFIARNGVATVAMDQVDVQPEVRYSPPPRLRGSTARMQGFVLMRLRVDEKGKVVDARVIESTSERLEEPSVEISKEWVFEPASYQGKAVRSTVVVPFLYPVNS